MGVSGWQRVGLCVYAVRVPVHHPATPREHTYPHWVARKRSKVVGGVGGGGGGPSREKRGGVEQGSFHTIFAHLNDTVGGSTY